VQATLCHQMKKAAEADPDLGDFLRQWVNESEATAKAMGIVQTASVTGDNNTTIQVSGAGSVTSRDE
jgi:hypothetical protein